MIANNLDKIHSRIANACAQSGRNPEDITLIGITKYAEAAQVEEAITAGLEHIGENRVQDAGLKFGQIPSIANVTRHLVGHLQTNKVKPALELFDLIESIDSIRLVREVQKNAEKLGVNVQILAQVNIARESQKFGLDADEVKPLLEVVAAECPRVHMRGLMTIAPFTEDQSVIRECFSGLRLLSDKLAKEYRTTERITFDELSMGMSADYEIAIEEGATMIRIGRAIFHGE